MPAGNVLNGGLLVRGGFQADDMNIPSSSVGDSQMDASRPIDVDKQIHQYSKQFAQAHGTGSVDYRGSIHTALGAGEILFFRAKVSVIPVGGATVTVDLKKNGTTVLSGVITIDNTAVAFEAQDATLSSPTYAADDEFEVVVDATTGGGTLPQGLSVLLVVAEASV